MLRECTTTELVDEIKRLRAANDELRTELEGHLVFWRVDGSYRCKDCMVVAPGDPARGGHAPRPYPHDMRCVITRTTQPEGSGDE